ncbi:MAG TPA: hypothetical protein VF209_03650 [Patescibacteria group bacterium]
MSEMLVIGSPLDLQIEYGATGLEPYLFLSALERACHTIEQEGNGTSFECFYMGQRTSLSLQEQRELVEIELAMDDLGFTAMCFVKISTAEFTVVERNRLVERLKNDLDTYLKVNPYHLLYEVVTNEILD